MKAYFEQKINDLRKVSDPEAYIRRLSYNDKELEKKWKCEQSNNYTYIQTIKTNDDVIDLIDRFDECYNENHPYDNEEIKADFNALYQAMNGMPLREMDKVIYPVCKLCRDHEQAGFIEGIKVGMRFEQELAKE